MASHFLDIEVGLIKLYETAGLSYPVEYPEVPLVDKPTDDIWIGLRNIRGTSTVATYGSNGENNNPGIFQIDINTPKDQGTGLALGIADQIINTLNAGSSITENGQKVRISQVSVSPSRESGGYHRISVSLNYYARTVRS